MINLFLETIIIGRLMGSHTLIYSHFLANFQPISMRIFSFRGIFILYPKIKFNKHIYVNRYTFSDFYGKF